MLFKGWQCTSLNTCNRFRDEIKETDLEQTSCLSQGLVNRILLDELYTVVK